MNEISNEDLQPADIPAPDADWNAIGVFALRFNGYETWGSFEKCAEIAEARSHETLTDLRTCLFFEQRRWRHYGDIPDEDAMTYIRQVLEKIRVKVMAGETR